MYCAATLCMTLASINASLLIVAFPFPFYYILIFTDFSGFVLNQDNATLSSENHIHLPSLMLISFTAKSCSSTPPQNKTSCSKTGEGRWLSHIFLSSPRHSNSSLCAHIEVVQYKCCLSIHEIRISVSRIYYLCKALKTTQSC